MEREGFRIQHMGLKDNEGVPNSFESIIKNYRGAQEMDTFLLRDGEIAVINDRLVKMTPTEVESMTLAELEAHVNEMNPEAVKEKTIPTLKEFMGVASDADTQLRVELRGSSAEQVRNLARAAIEQVADMNTAGGFSKNPDYPSTKLRFVTFSIPGLQAAQTTATEKGIPASIGLFWPSSENWASQVDLYDEGVVAQVPDLEGREWNERGIIVAKHFGFSEIELQPDVITPDHVKLAHELGLEIGASIVRDKSKAEEVAEKLAAIGVDHILTEK